MERRVALYTDEMIYPSLAAALREKGWLFYTDVDPGGAARLMCSWDTTSEDVAAFLRDAATAHA